MSRAEPDLARVLVVMGIAPTNSIGWTRRIISIYPVLVGRRQSRPGGGDPRTRRRGIGGRERLLPCMLRARLSSFFAAAASGLVFYFLHKDYMIAQKAISQQVGSSCPSPPFVTEVTLVCVG
ncbi:hypothetical protein Taro_034677 [Colocasia esculenta]|uniref:Uncharacterized protein n=1 Tax=Colocasia esculenta TaxID=4460 RepID=A0A843WG79_COLES|nr:hypothetical protein [Colocasia esculenta]